MDDLDRKILEEVKDLLSSASLKLFEMLKEPTQKTFVSETVEITDRNGILFNMHNGQKFIICLGCSNYISWDQESDKYLHYTAGFEQIITNCEGVALP